MPLDGIIFGEKPSRCPSSSCLAQSSDFVRIGFTKPLICLKGKRRQRFQCRKCKRSFTENYFKIHYRLMHNDPSLNYWIFQFFIHGMPLRRIARLLEISTHSTRIRIKRLAQRALDFHQATTSNLLISEPICIDGLENFAKSQYEPNNVNHAVGYNSLFIYDENFAPLNRKGRTSDQQKLRLAAIESIEGRFDPRAIRTSFADLVRRLYSKRADKGSPLQIISDEHFQYRRALARELFSLKIRHDTISSKVWRNFQNILFSANHSDLLIRKMLAPFMRETISFSKTHGMMMQKYGLFAVYKNYMQPQFSKKHVRRPRAHLESPAMALGLFEKVLKFEDIFSERSRECSTCIWNEDWKAFWHGEVPKKYHRSKKFNKVA